MAIDYRDQKGGGPPERPKGDPKADLGDRPGGTEASGGGGQGIRSGLQPGGTKPGGGTGGGTGQTGTGGASSAGTGNAAKTPVER